MGGSHSKIEDLVQSLEIFRELDKGQRFKIFKGAFQMNVNSAMQRLNIEVEDGVVCEICGLRT